MARVASVCAVSVLALILWGAGGCQMNNKTEEIRSEEQMLEVSFENERAEDLFLKAVNTTYGQPINVKRIGLPGLSVYSRGEEIAWNATCNDHLRQMDTDADRIITEHEAQAHYDALIAAPGS